MPPRRRHLRRAPLPAEARSSATANIDAVPEETQRAVYQALVEATAAGLAPEAARYQVARQFRVTIVKVEAVEAKGLAQRWSLRSEEAAPSRRRRQ